MGNKVLLNKMYSDTLLALAFQEDLLVADRLETDGVYESYKSMTIDHYLAKSLLEQLLLSPQPILRKPFLQSVTGPLIEKEPFFLFDDCKIEQIMPLKQYSEEMYLGILKGSGNDMSSEQFKEFVNQTIYCKDEYDRLENDFGGAIPQLWHKQFMSLIDNDYSYLEDERYKRLNEINELADLVTAKFKPLIEFFELQTLAEKHSAMIKMPIKYSHFNFQMNEFETTENQTLLLRLVEKEFNYISLRTTSLKDTIELSKRPEFVAYRLKQNEWINKIVIGDDNGLNNIRKEIRIAKKYIDKLPIIENGGNVLAYIGVPLALCPLTLPVGLGLAIVGIIPAGAAHFINKKYKWAMINRLNN